ncbi:hypothetical protein JOD24_001640 [Kroppenstedtia sanguinis]
MRHGHNNLKLGMRHGHNNLKLGMRPKHYNFDGLKPWSKGSITGTTISMARLPSYPA